MEKVQVSVTSARPFAALPAPADQSIYPDPPSVCIEFNDGTAGICGFWGALGSDYEHSLCRYAHNIFNCGICQGTVQNGNMAIVESVDGEFGPCVYKTYMRGESQSQTPYLIMNDACTTNRHSLWVPTIPGFHC